MEDYSLADKVADKVVEWVAADDKAVGIVVVGKVVVADNYSQGIVCRIGKHFWMKICFKIII